MSAGFRLARRIATAVLLLAQGAAQVTTARPLPSRIVAIGDIHGDYDRFVEILQKSGLIDPSLQWIGGRATLVQTGDFLDRGVRVRDVMDLLMRLEQGAQKAGGRVVVLLGNHETMNLMGEMRDVSPEAYGTFADAQSEHRREAAYTAYQRLARERSADRAPVPDVYRVPPRAEWLAGHPLGYVEYKEALGPSGKYGKWLRGKPIVAHVGDTIFLHGGIHPDLAHKSLDQYNQRAKKEISDFDDYVRALTHAGVVLPFFTLVEIVGAARAELEVAASAAPAEREAMLSGLPLVAADALNRVGTWSIINPNGPLWYRGFATWTPEEGATHIARLLSLYNAKHFAVGHTIPASMRITPRFSSRVFLIDTGMLSTHYQGGRASALEIQDGRYSAIYVDERLVLLDTTSSETPAVKPGQ